MKVSPYKPWLISNTEYPVHSSIEEQAQFLIRYAILAPSSHNTQPWKFEAHSNIIKIFPDYQYALPYSDRTHRELTISLGCSLANIIIAASHFGFDTSVSYYPENDLRSPAVIIRLNEQKHKKRIAELFPLITKRTTNRSDYLARKISDDELEKIFKYINEPSIKVDVIQNDTIRSSIIDLVIEATQFAFNDKIFKNELSQWVRSNYTSRHDGMPLFGFGIPDPISILAPIMIKNMFASIQAKLDKNLLETTPAFIVLSAKTNDKDTWIKIGEVYECLTLACLQQEIATAPMAGIIEYDKTNEKLRKLLHTENIPLFFARMGYSKQTPHHSPRKDLEEVIV